MDSKSLLHKPGWMFRHSIILTTAYSSAASLQQSMTTSPVTEFDKSDLSTTSLSIYLEFFRMFSDFQQLPDTVDKSLIMEVAHPLDIPVMFGDTRHEMLKKFLLVLPILDSSVCK